MEQNYLNKLEKIEPVLVPDFLMEGIKNKIIAEDKLIIVSSIAGIISRASPI